MLRGHGGSRPTKDGRRLAEAVADGFGQVASVCSELRSKTRSDPAIVVACPPGFAFNWLFPRLIDFDQSHPEISVSISTTIDSVDFFAGYVDVSIRYGIGGYIGLHVEELFSETVFPVCSPRLREQLGPLASHSEVFGQTLLLDEFGKSRGNPPTWKYWAEKMGLTVPKESRCRRFGQSNMVVQAAISGYGFALGRLPLVIDALVQGTLVRPFSEVVDSEFSYWITCPKQSLTLPRIASFISWLKEQAAIQPDLPPPHCAYG